MNKRYSQQKITKEERKFLRQHVGRNDFTYLAYLATRKLGREYTETEIFLKLKGVEKSEEE